MNKLVSLPGVVVLLALGSDAHATTKSSYKTKGNAASYTAYTPTECGYEYVTVYVFEERSSGNRTAHDSAYIDYMAQDFCTGSSTYGSGALDGTAFDVKKLQSASVDGTGTMAVTTCMYGDGGGAAGVGGMGGMGPVGGVGGVGGVAGMAGVGGMGGAGGGGEEDPCTVSVALSLVWTGTGDTYKDRYVQVSSTPSARYRYVSNGQSREATVTGSLSIDGAPVSSSNGYASLSYSSSASFEIIH